MPVVGVVVHESFGAFVVFAGAAFDEVAGEGEGCSDEADEGLGWREFFVDEGDALGDFFDVRVEDGEGVDVCAGADGGGHDGSAARDDVDVDACGF